MTAGISRFLILSALLHIGVMLAWRTPDMPGIRYEGGPPLRLALVPERPVRPAGDTHPAARPEDPPGVPGPSPVTAREQQPAPATPPDRPRADPATRGGDTIQERPAAARPTVRPTRRAGTRTRGEAPARTAETAATGAETRTAEAVLSHRELTERIRAAAATYFYYPPLAQRRGWEGEVRVGLHVTADGRLTAIRLLKSSGYRVLDQAAMRSLEHVAALPEVGARIRGGMDIELPIEYRLVDA